MFFIVGLVAQSQKVAVEQSVDYKSSLCRSAFTKVYLSQNYTESTIREYLYHTLPNLDDKRCGLKLNYVQHSPAAWHYSYIQTFEGIPVYQSEIKVNIDHNNIIHSLFDNSENTRNWYLQPHGVKGNLFILVDSETGLPVVTQRDINELSEEIFSVNDKVVYRHSLRSYFTTDSMVSANVFKPDPLTTAQQNYLVGTFYSDNNDSANTALNGQLQTVSIKTTFNGSTFLLESPYVRVLDFDAPNIAPVTSNSPQFLFNRSQSAFEDVNAFYHISAMQYRVQSLGFNCADSLVDIDTHAMSGADNSYFSPATIPNRIYYGTGGVDDAEDADVCVHEYGHFISQNAAPGSNFGQQRNALDEAFGDYLAASYSNSISSYNNNWIFNWDGHNEFWNGRVMNTIRVYPNDLQTSIYKNGEIWSAALYAIHNEIGRGATDSLILQTHYSYAQNITMADAAQLLIDADTLLNNGHYYCAIYRHLLERGFVSSNTNNNCGFNGFSYNNELNVVFKPFANFFEVHNPERYNLTVQLYNMSGQLIQTMQQSSISYSHYANQTASGVYLIVVKAGSQTRVFKWCKLN